MAERAAVQKMLNESEIKLKMLSYYLGPVKIDGEIKCGKPMLNFSDEVAEF